MYNVHFRNAGGLWLRWIGPKRLPNNLLMEYSAKSSKRWFLIEGRMIWKWAFKNRIPEVTLANQSWHCPSLPSQSSSIFPNYTSTEAINKQTLNTYSNKTYNLSDLIQFLHSQQGLLSTQSTLRCVRMFGIILCEPQKENTASANSIYCKLNKMHLIHSEHLNRYLTHDCLADRSKLREM